MLESLIFNNCSLVTSIFTLQFMSPKDRQEVINKIYNGLKYVGQRLSFQKKLLVVILEYKI